MKRLTFTKKPCKVEEYIVQNKRQDVLGQIAFWKVKGHKKSDWWFFVDWNPMDGDHDFWLGEDCLREIADFIKMLKSSPNNNTCTPSEDKK